MNSRLYKYGQEGGFSYGEVGGGLCLYNGGLLNETFGTETTFDALNRPKSIKQPDNTTLYYGVQKTR